MNIIATKENGQYRVINGGQQLALLLEAQGQATVIDAQTGQSVMVKKDPQGRLIETRTIQ